MSPKYIQWGDSVDSLLLENRIHLTFLNRLHVQRCSANQLWRCKATGGSLRSTECAADSREPWRLSKVIWTSRLSTQNSQISEPLRGA